MGPLPTSDFIERCQLDYQRNPGSKVFAPLAEAYRRLGLLPQAFEVASRGVRLHPNFAAGRIAFARVLIDQGDLEDARDQLIAAGELSPDNLLAFQLLGDVFLQLRRPREALQAYKMVLLLNPQHERAQQVVRKWEFLSADDFDDEVFEAAEEAPLRTSDELEELDPELFERELHRTLSMADALTIRNDLHAAFDRLRRARRQLGPHDELDRRLRMLAQRLQMSDDELTQALSTRRSSGQKKRERLELILKRIQERTRRHRAEG
ncbi:MAG TPA: tetratricopeptide repeat protein [Pseudobdellovibrionaceae bacterium]|nr:tetratricopeptide repeat protein [Pseudobdellovibrionaceae bacterium]